MTFLPSDYTRVQGTSEMMTHYTWMCATLVYDNTVLITQSYNTSIAKRTYQI